MCLFSLFKMHRKSFGGRVLPGSAPGAHSAPHPSYRSRRPLYARNMRWVGGGKWKGEGKKGEWSRKWRKMEYIKEKRGKTCCFNAVSLVGDSIQVAYTSDDKLSTKNFDTWWRHNIIHKFCSLSDNNGGNEIMKKYTEIICICMLH